MNPIEKITDPTFTNSSKGLLTLFCIGLVHTVVGIDLTSTEIAIPWLPSINFPNTDRLPYIYWALVGFAIYRYTLHYIPTIKMYYFLSMERFFRKDKRGEDLIRKEILSSKLSYKVSIIDIEGDQPSIKIVHSQHDGNYLESVCVFEIIFKEGFIFDKITFSENPDHQIDEIALKTKGNFNKWGLRWFIDEEGNEEYESYSIKDSKLENALRFGVMKNYFRILISSKDAFDLLMPIVLNISLFVVWIINASFTA